MMAPRRFRDREPAFPASDADILPISQINPSTGLPETRAMRHDVFQANLVAAVNAARQELVDGFNTVLGGLAETDAQIEAAIVNLQAHDSWIDVAVGQIQTLETQMQAAIDTLEDKVDHPAQWSEIANKPSTFPPSAHTHLKADITDFPTTWAWGALTGVPATFPPSAHTHTKSQITDFPTTWAWSDITGKPATFPAAAPAWTDVTGKPSTFPPSAHTHVKADITDFAHTHAQSEIAGLTAALAAKLDGPLVIGSPNAVTPAFGTAYQATNPAKPSFISAMINAAYTVTVASTQADTVELRIGNNATTVANGTGGFVAATFRASLTGIALVIGMGIEQRNQLTAMLPTGWFYALRRTAGTTATITSATDQSLG